MRALIPSLFAISMLSSSALAAPFRHDPGFFFRGALGVGFSGASLDDSQETTFTGAGGLVSLAVGGTVAPNFALYADLFGFSMLEPTVSQNGVEAGKADDTTATLAAIGLGASYYLMPLNLYFAGSIGTGQATIETRARVGPVEVVLNEDSKPGLAVSLMVGKEWWVSRRWGMGIAGQAIFGRVETDGGTELGLLGFGVLFSATMN